MPLPKRWNKKRSPPPGFDIVEPILESLEHELRDKIKETNEKKRKTESIWPVHQIGWQKSRYIYDMYYTYGNISREVYDYCLKQKLVDPALIAKWKKPGYERLCSTYVINPSNYKFGTTSICRVPMRDRSTEQKTAQDPTTGCLGCASGKGAGPRNIFGNKYGQYLAAVQIAREERLEKLAEKRRKAEEEEELAAGANTKTSTAADGADDDDETTDDDSDTDDEDEEDYGLKPVAGIWAGSNKLQHQSEKMIVGKNDGASSDDMGDEDTEDSDDEEGPALPPPSKKLKT